jgi:hypothetical protein
MAEMQKMQEQLFALSFNNFYSRQVAKETNQHERKADTRISRGDAGTQGYAENQQLFK